MAVSFGKKRCVKNPDSFSQFLSLKILLISKCLKIYTDAPRVGGRLIGFKKMETEQAAWSYTYDALKLQVVTIDIQSLECYSGQPDPK